MRRIAILTTAITLVLLLAAPASAQEGEPGFWASSVGMTDVDFEGEPPSATDAAGDAAAIDGGGPVEPDITSVMWYADRSGGEVARAIETLLAEEQTGQRLFTIYGDPTLRAGEYRFAEIYGSNLTGEGDFQVDLTGLRPGGVGGPSGLAVHPFKGKDVAYSLFSAGGEPPQSAGYEHTAAGYGDLDHAPLWLVADGLIVVVIPEELLAEATSWTLWVSSGQWGFGNTYDAVELPGLEAPVTAGFVPAAATPAETSPASDEPSTTSTTALAAVEIGDEGGTGSFSVLVLVPLAVGGVVVGYVVWRTFSRTRERGTPGGAAIAGGDDDDTPPRDAPPPVVYGEELDDDARCDWAVYWQNPGGVLVPLREAKGHECCVYTVAVTGRLLDHAEAAIVRQAPELVGAGGEPVRARLQAEEHGLWGGGLSPAAWTTARSGPAGDQSWVQGTGERASRPAAGSAPATTDPALPASGPLDVGSRIRYLDQTRIGIRLDSGCDHDNHFHAHGATTATVFSTYECANEEPGSRCPVEVVAAGTFRSQVSGDLAYEVTARALHDTQDPLPSDDVPVVTVGSHDHASRPRADHEETVSGHGDVDNDGDAIEIVVTDLLDLNAGVVVPPATWDSTGRVSAALSVGLDQTVQLDAEMANHDDGACCGRAGCDCAPSLRLVVAGGTATVDVDGTTFTALAPTWPSSGAEQEWRL